MSSRTTLNPGDLVAWDEEREDRALVIMMVSDDGEELLFQFGTKPWSQMQVTPDGEYGLSVQQAGHVLESPSTLALRDYGLHGRLYKCFDKATGQSFPDPKLELGDA